MVPGIGNSFDIFGTKPSLTMNFGAGDMFNDMSFAMASAFNTPMFDPTMMGGNGWNYDPMTGQPINPNIGQAPRSRLLDDTQLTQKQEEEIKENIVSNMTDNDDKMLKELLDLADKTKKTGNVDIIKAVFNEKETRNAIEIYKNNVILNSKASTTVSDEFKDKVELLYTRLRSLTNDLTNEDNRNEKAVMAITAFALGKIQPDELNASTLDHLCTRELSMCDKTEEAIQPQELLYVLGYFQKNKFTDDFLATLAQDKWFGYLRCVAPTSPKVFNSARGTLAEFLFDDSKKLLDAHESAKEKAEQAKKKEAELKKTFEEKSAEIANLKDNSYFGDNKQLNEYSTNLISGFENNKDKYNIKSEELTNETGMTQDRKQHLDTLVDIIFQNNPDKATVVNMLKLLCNIHSNQNSGTPEARALDCIYLCNKASEVWNTKNPKVSFWDNDTQNTLGSILNDAAKKALPKEKTQTSV